MLKSCFLSIVNNHQTTISYSNVLLCETGWYRTNNNKKKTDSQFLFFSNEYIHLLAIHGTSSQCLARYDTFFSFFLNDERIKLVEHLTTNSFLFSSFRVQLCQSIERLSTPVLTLIHSFYKNDSCTY
jgi:hypothetical protein